MLKEFEDHPYDPVIQSSTSPSSSADLIEYAEALRTKPISNTRSIVAICRKSGSRRTELRNIIMEGIRDGTWPHLRVVQLLRDCVTRWSSTYNMIDRCIELYPVRFILMVSTISYNTINRQLSISSASHPYPSIPISYSGTRNSRFWSTFTRSFKLLICVKNYCLQRDVRLFLLLCRSMRSWWCIGRHFLRQYQSLHTISN